ncbi:MAG: hypothetical protein KA734_00015 [Fluviicola sp.]|nr:hypothetical protein [Fluviicola sp.]
MILAIFLPWLSFLIRGQIIPSLLALFFQILAVLTVAFFGFGFFIWVALAIWSVSARSTYNMNKKINQLKP